jgi:hypothetical protein
MRSSVSFHAERCVNVPASSDPNLTRRVFDAVSVPRDPFVREVRRRHVQQSRHGPERRAHDVDRLARVRTRAHPRKSHHMRL